MNAPVVPVTLVFAESDRPPGPDAGSPFPDSALCSRMAAEGGFEVKSLPGSLMAAFPGAAAAVRWALAAQLTDVAAGGPGLRVGIATGEAIVERDPGTARADYFGPTVNRAARIMAAANPGQTLLSEAAHVAAAADMGAASDADLGEHRLRGIERPERLHQALPAPWRGRSFPPLRTLRTLPTNLPLQSSSFVGREAEMSALMKLHADPSVRVVVLTGGAGVGKTRLAVRAAAGLVDRLPGGVWFADLAEAGGAEGIAGMVAEALGLPGGTNPIAIVGASLEMRGPSLIVLDTFDQHLAHAAETVGAWSARAPDARFLVTSRALTGLPGERELRIESLAVGSARAPGPAIHLFADRAREARPGFELTEANAEDVARICEELEGLALAIELAAARVRILQPAEILKKLGQKFQLLRSARKDTVRRQQTLHGAIEWSEEQLVPWERAALRQFSVFRGGWDAEAADAVVDLSAHPGAPGGAVVARALVARSLLSVRETDLGTRFEMSRTVREYAEGRLAPEGPESRPASEARHAAWFGTLAERLDSAAAEVRDRVRPELANFFVLQDRIPTLGPGLFAAAATAIASCRSTIQWRGPMREGLERFARLYNEAAAYPPLPDQVHIRLLIGYVRLLRSAGNYRGAVDVAEKCVALCREKGGSGALTEVLWELAYCSGTLSDYRRSDEALDEAEKVSREKGHRVRLLSCLLLRAARIKAQGKPAEGLRLSREALDLARQIPEREDAVSEAMNGVANMLSDADDPVEAARLFRSAIEIDLRLGNDGGRSTKLGNLGDVLLDMGDTEGALRSFREASELDRRLGRSLYYAYERLRESGALRVDGKLEAASSALDEAERLLDANPANQLSVVTRQRRAELRFDQGDFPGALKTALEALAFAHEDQDVARVLESRVIGARALLAMGRPGEARSMLAAEATAQIATGLSRLSQFGLLAACCQIHESLGEIDEARQMAKEALELAEGIRATYSAASEKLRLFLPIVERIARS